MMWAWNWHLFTAFELAWVLVAGYVIVLQRRSAAATIAWLLALTFLPIFGLLLYRLIGPLRLKRKRMRHRYSRDIVAEVTGARTRLTEGLGEDAQIARVAINLHEAPPLRAAHVALYFEGADFYAALLQAIAAAQRHIHLEFYIWEPDRIGLRIRDALIAKARAGVQVRLLLDGTGSSRIGRKFLRPLQEAGVEFARFNPVQLRFLRKRRIDFRTHRKIVVCDGRVGFTGGMNITEEQTREFSPGAWRDTHLQLQGTAVWPLQRMFLEDWYFATEALPTEPDELLFPSQSDGGPHIVQVVGSGPDHDQTTLLHTFFTAITRAEARVWLTTPYFVPEEPLVAALCTASLRRLDVRLIIPRRGDSRLIDLAARSYLPELIAAGVKVYQYLPRFVHAKTFVIDDDLSIVGSANLDTRSLRLNFEVVAVLYDPALNAVLATAFEQDLTHCEPIELEQLKNLPRFVRFAQASARLFSPLL